MPKCVFCSSYNVQIPADSIVRCLDCWRMHFDPTVVITAQEEIGHWLDCNHTFIETGTKLSWCKHCNITAYFSFKHGRYLTDEDLTILSWNPKENSD